MHSRDSRVPHSRPSLGLASPEPGGRVMGPSIVRKVLDLRVHARRWCNG